MIGDTISAWYKHHHLLILVMSKPQQFFLHSLLRRHHLIPIIGVILKRQQTSVYKTVGKKKTPIALVVCASLCTLLNALVVLRKTTNILLAVKKKWRHRGKHNILSVTEWQESVSQWSDRITQILATRTMSSHTAIQ